MVIRSVEFVGSFAEPDSSLPSDLPQIAFCGRSNVGKSSLINVLLRRSRRKLAYVSSRPGKTRSLNFYRVNDRFFLVDLPGFGFARVPSTLRQRWMDLVNTYLERKSEVSGVVHLVDARHDPMAADHRMLERLGELGLPTLVAVTKIDRIGRGERNARLERIIRRLELDPEQVVPFSSRTGEGRDELLQAIESLLPPETATCEVDA